MPRLREDLIVVDRHEQRRSTGSRLIYDPLRHRYLRVDRETYELLTLLPRNATPQSLREMAAERFGLDLDEERLAELLRFVAASGLAATEPARWRDLMATAARQRPSLLMRLLHGYLFFRVPLFAPQAFLTASLPFVRHLMTRTMLALTAALGLIGLYLVFRQWDEFVATFADFASLQGLAGFAVVTLLVKVLHELGHAYVAVSRGCRVPSLGVAFLFLTPLFYTDVTDAWRLPRRADRLAIDVAGIAVELTIAALATFLWAFLPAGTAKSLAFMLATVAWIMSLAINLNPFMRFDGYYILADAIGVDNLQPRAFALGRWKMREVLFGLRRPPPETFSLGMRRFLIAYAWATWVYRLVLYAGIAVLVYALTFKVLGILLFLVEIGLLIAVPVWRELREWWAMRQDIVGSSRLIVTLAVLAAITAVAVVPWSTRISVPAVMEARDLAQVYPPRDAMIEAVTVGRNAEVAQGDVLVRLSSADLDQQLTLARVELAAVEVRLARRAADTVDLAESLVLAGERTRLEVRIAGLEAERAALVLRAPIAGRVVELNRDLHPGRWVSRADLIALVGRSSRTDREAADGRTLVARGYVAEADIARLPAAAEGRFIPDDSLLPAWPVRLSGLSRTGATAIDIPALASIHGGPIGVERDRTAGLVPVSANYLAELDIVAGEASSPQPASRHPVRGLIHLTGEPESILAAFWRQVLKVLVRESGA